MTKRELTFIELLVIIAIVTVLAVIVLSALARARGDARRSSCQNNLKQMWLVCEMYANETGGAYPAIKARDCDGSVHKQFCINSFALYPKYMTDPAILLCPTAPSNKGLGDSFTEVTTAKYTPTGVWNGTAFEPLPAEADHLFFPCEVSVTTCNYFYLGWALYVPGITDDPHSFTSTNSTALIAEISKYFADQPRIASALAGNFTSILLDLAERMRNADPTAVDQDIRPNGSSLALYRLKKGVGRFFITDTNNLGSVKTAQSLLPVSSDYIALNTTGGLGFNHVPGGCNVLYMDGHVDFLMYPDGFPANPMAARMMSLF